MKQYDQRRLLAMMTPEPSDEIREDSGNPAEAEPAREAHGPRRSGLTRWVAERELKKLPASGAPSYERCQQKDCWGKANWSCPRCSQKNCSAHRAEHQCSLPYLPG
ncbi:MAG TPA: hypothetical protein VKU60_01575 [Chloroflexota bacterium]|nr:hypothetical protein [Chloroflexota bacterium]